MVEHIGLRIAEGQAKPVEIVVRHIPQRHRYAPAQLLVSCEPQPLQASQVAQLRRYRPAQLIIVEVQP